MYTNKVPRHLIKEGNCYIACQFLISHDQQYPFVHLIPRSGAFEVSYGRDLLWSRLATGHYPRTVHFKERCANIIKSEQNIDFIDLSDIHLNLSPQSSIKPRMRSIPYRVPEYKESHFVTPKLFKEFKQKQMMA